MEKRFIQENVTFLTIDNKKIAATFYEGGEKAVILLHQLNLDKSSWEPLAKKLQEKDYSVLAVDLRGHGESVGDWKTFPDSEFVAMLNDANAAAKFLREKRKQVKIIMGASIGANTAFRFSAEHKVTAVLLSPGLIYRGIDINDLTSTAKTLIIAAEQDSYSATSAKELEKNNLFGEYELLLLPGEKHGTHLLDEKIINKIFEFIKESASF